MKVDGRHLENRKNRDISKTVEAISTQSGLLIHTGSPDHMGRETSNVYKSKMADGRHLVDQSAPLADNDMGEREE